MWRVRRAGSAASVHRKLTMSVGHERLPVRRRKCMRCLTEQAVKRGGLAPHKCSHGARCETGNTGPACDDCRDELELYWMRKRETL
jgi:hypothetical protein